MRNAFAKTVTRLAEQNERIVLLSGDIGNRLFDQFKGKYPQRFYNCGVAEANMTGVAAGLALAGMQPITYTITPFNVNRCYEQIRNDLCYQNLPVIIVGVGSGYSYASLGATHHSCEDIAVLRVLPNITIICPADAAETEHALNEATKLNGPTYLRLGKKNEPPVPQIQNTFKVGKANILRDGDNICILSTGWMTHRALQIADALIALQWHPKVIHIPTIKPLDVECLQQVFDQFELVVSIEEHSKIGGFGAAIAEWVVDQLGVRAKLLRLGTADRFVSGAVTPEDARAQMGLSVNGITDQILTAMNFIGIS